MTDYRARLRLAPEAIDAGAELPLRTPTGLVLATGFSRVVIGGRGPYLEFRDDQVIPEAMHWTRAGYFYDEHRSNDVSNVKIYQQRATVDYADYLVGMWYVSPFDLVSETGVFLIDPLPRKRSNAT